MEASRPYPSESHVEEQGAPLDDLRAFRRALGQFATGVTVITAMTETGPVGMAVNSFAAVSLDPPLISWSIRNESRSRKIFTECEHFAVSILADDQIDACTEFGKSGATPFDVVPWHLGEGGAPLLDRAIAHFECVRETTFPGGDHEIIIGRVEHFTRFSGEPLLFTQGQYRVASDHPQTKATVAFAEQQVSDDAETMFISLLRSAERSASDRFEESREQLGLNAIASRIMSLLAIHPHNVEQLSAGALVGTADALDTVRDLISRCLVIETNAGYYLSLSGQHTHSALRAKAQVLNAQLTDSIQPTDLAVARHVLLQLLTP